MTIRLGVIAVVVMLAAFVAAPTAHAAVWQGPVVLSDPAKAAGDAPGISLGAAGDAAVAWWDASSGSVLVRRRLAGGIWSDSWPIGSSATPVKALSGVDGTGNVTAVWTGTQRFSDTTIATWPVNAVGPSLDKFTWGGARARLTGCWSHSWSSTPRGPP